MHEDSTKIPLRQALSFWIPFVLFATAGFFTPDPHGIGFAASLGIGMVLCCDNSIPAKYSLSFLRRLYKNLALSLPKFRRLLLFLWPLISFSIILLLEPVAELAFAGWASTGSIWNVGDLPRNVWQEEPNGKLIFAVFLLMAAWVWRKWLIELPLDSSEGTS